MIFQGNDGGSVITALTLDMSGAGKAIFNAGAEFASTTLHYGNGAAALAWGDTSGVGQLSFSGNNAILRSTVSDGNLVLQGNDGGSTITALTLDMSAAGKGIFNAGATFANRVEVNYNGDYQLKIGNGASEPWYQRVQSDGTFALHLNGSGNIFHATSTGTTTTGLHTSTQSANITQVAITFKLNAVAWDARAAGNAYHVTTENTTFSAPSNAVEGAIIQVEIAQGGTARTIAWNTVFEFAASTAPTVTATANKTDIFTFRYNGSVWQEIGRVQNLAQT